METTPAPETPSSAAHPTPPGGTRVLPLRRHRRRALFFGATLFLCGLLLGHAGTLFWVHYRMRARLGHPERMTRRLVTRIRGGLDLNEEEVEDVRAAVARHHEAIVALHRDMSRRVEAELERLRDEVAAALPEAKAARWRNGFRRFLPPPPPPPPPHRGRGPGG